MHGPTAATIRSRRAPSVSIAATVESVVPGAPRREEAFVGHVGGGEAIGESLIDLVTGARDARADRGADVFAPRTQNQHRVDRRIGDAGQCALPPGMRGTDNAGLRIGEQHRRAIGGDDAEYEPRTVGDQRVGMRAGIVAPGLRHGHHLCAVDLIGGHERRAGADRSHRAGAVLRHDGRIVARAQPCVQPSDDAAGHAAAAAQEPVRDAKQLCAEQVEGHSASRRIRSRSVCVPVWNA